MAKKITFRAMVSFRFLCVSRILFDAEMKHFCKHPLLPLLRIGQRLLCSNYVYAIQPLKQTKNCRTRVVSGMQQNIKISLFQI